MTEDDIARAAAQRLASEMPPGFPETVEARISDPNPGRDTYLEPVTVSLAAVLVGAASLGWTIYKDLKAANRPSSQEGLARTIRIQLVVPEGVPQDRRDRIIEAVAQEIVHNPKA